MRNNVKLIVALILTLIALPMFGNAVFADDSQVNDNGKAETEEPSALQGTEDNDEQKVSYIILQDAENEISGSTANYFDGTARLTEVDGTKTIEMDFEGKGARMITELDIQGLDTSVTRNDDGSGTLSFTVDEELPEALHLDMIIDTGAYGPGIMKHTVRLFFNKESMSDISKELLESSKIYFYTMNFEALHAKENKPSSMARYMADKAFVVEKGGKYEVTLGVADETVTLIQLGGKDSIDTKVNEKTRHETFELDSLSDVANAYVEYQAPYKGELFESDADFRMSFDEESKEGESSDLNKYQFMYVPKPAERPDNEDDKDQEETDKDQEDTNKEETEQEQDETNKDKQDNEANNNEEKPEAKDPLAADKAYTIDYTIKHETQDKASAGDQFFVKPATLLEKDGEKYLQVTVKGSQYIKGLTTNHGEMVLVEKNEDGSIVVQFKVDGAISDMIELGMTITVPGIYENRHHDARLFLDESSMEEADASDYRLVASDNGNGPTVEGESGEKVGTETDTDQPTGETNQETGKTNQETGQTDQVTGETNQETEQTTKVSGQETNPQTGDTTNIWLYVFLLIGSAVPLVLIVRRRFAA